MDDSFELHVQHIFDSFCKKVLKNEAIDIRREYARFNKRFTSLEMLPTESIEELSYLDEYSVDSEIFLILGFEILIKDSQMAQAINSLSEIRRRIILLYFFSGFNDREIAQILGINSKTVWYQRISAIKELGSLIVSKQYEN